MSKFGEKLLYARLKNKDKKAFIKAYNLFAEQIYKFIYFKVGSEEEAKDLTSAVFLKSWNHVLSNNLAEAKTLRALFYRIARNTIIDHYRQNSQYQQISLDNDDKLTDLLNDDNQLMKSMEIKSDINNVESALLKLKDEYREIIIMRYIQQLSTNEIAEIIDKPKGATRVALHRALQTLKKIIEDKK